MKKFKAILLALALAFGVVATSEVVNDPPAAEAAGPCGSGHWAHLGNWNGDGTGYFNRYSNVYQNGQVGTSVQAGAYLGYEIYQIVIKSQYRGNLYISLNQRNWGPAFYPKWYFGELSIYSAACFRYD